MAIKILTYLLTVNGRKSNNHNNRIKQTNKHLAISLTTMKIRRTANLSPSCMNFNAAESMLNVDRITPLNRNELRNKPIDTNSFVACQKHRDSAKLTALYPVTYSLHYAQDVRNTDKIRRRQLHKTFSRSMHACGNNLSPLAAAIASLIQLRTI